MQATTATNQNGRNKGLRVLLLSSVLLLGACSNEIKVHGNIPDPEVLANIHPGVDNRSDVLNKLGSPSTLSTFQDNIWYYIGSRAEQGPSIFPAEEIERSVFAVSFTPAGIVQETKLYTLEDAQEVDLVDRETPTEGRELTFIEQMLGNLWRQPISSRSKNTK